MADDNDTSDKTEDPTQKRLDDAHERGDVAKSQEVNTWFVIAGATLVLSTFSGSIGGGIMMPLRNLIANSWMIHADGPGLLALAKSLAYVLIAALGVLARLMPQMQVYFVGVPLSILAGFLVFALVITAMMGTFLDYFIGIMHDLIPLNGKQ